MVRSWTFISVRHFVPPKDFLRSFYCRVILRDSFIYRLYFSPVAFAA
jgi:hypothetical protein